MSKPQDSASSAPRLGLSRRTWLLAAAAFGIGLLLFLLVWLDKRNDNEFFRTVGDSQSVSGQVFEPLPVPLPADTDDAGASGMRPADEQTARSPHIDERAPPAPSVATAPPAPAAPAPALAPSDSPVPISTPAPAYPPAALRRGETGTVLVRVEVAADGTPYAVDIARSSRSRALDRAALEAVRSWRFRPAQRDGQAVPGVVQVPIDFKTE